MTDDELARLLTKKLRELRATRDMLNVTVDTTVMDREIAQHEEALRRLNRSVR